MSRHTGQKFVNWQAVDWSRSDSEIGLRYGVSRNHACQMRHRLRKKQPEKFLLDASVYLLKRA